MVLTLAAVILFFSLASSSSSDAFFLPFNSSDIVFSPVLRPPPFSSSSPLFLKDVVEAIAEKERWDTSGEVRVSELDVAGARLGRSQRYTFRMRLGRTALSLRLSDEIGNISWQNPGSGKDIMAARDGAGGLKPVLGTLELEGPLDLRVAGEDDDLALHFPTLNITHRGLKQILVRRGMKVKLEGARQVSFAHPAGIGISLNGSFAIGGGGGRHFWPLGHSSCAPLLSAKVSGSVLVHSHWTRAAFVSRAAVEILPDKCYFLKSSAWVPSWSLQIFGSRFATMERLLGSFLNGGSSRSSSGSRSSARILVAKIMPLVFVKFRTELERDVAADDDDWRDVAEWRTRPSVERQWFEVVARAEEGKAALKPVAVKRLRSPSIVWDAIAWSSLMSNVSFAELFSAVVPPEALTLDVKW